jgi:hypothetical protein
MYFYGNNVLGYIPFPALLSLLLLIILPFVVISISAALSVAILPRHPPAILLGILFITYILPHVLILSEDRFHLALVPYTAILATLLWTSGFSPIISRWKESGLGKVLVLLGMISVFFLLLNWGLELIRDGDKILQLLGPNGNFSNFPY